MKVVVTGFDPFGGKAVNSVFEVVKRLPTEIAGAEIIRVEVPAVFGTSGGRVVEVIETHQSNMVIRARQAGGRGTVTVKRVAINLVKACISDNTGQQPSGVPLVEDGAATYFTNLPIKAAIKNCYGHQLSAAISCTAGTFVYSDIIYHLLHLINTKYPATHGGFIHVPFLPEQTIDKSTFVSMSLGTIIDSLFYMIEAAVKT